MKDRIRKTSKQTKTKTQENCKIVAIRKGVVSWKKKKSSQHKNDHNTNGLKLNRWPKICNVVIWINKHLYYYYYYNMNAWLQNIFFSFIFVIHKRKEKKRVFFIYLLKEINMKTKQNNQEPSNNSYITVTSSYISLSLI